MIRQSRPTCTVWYSFYSASLQPSWKEKGQRHDTVAEAMAR